MVDSDICDSIHFKVIADVQGMDVRIKGKGIQYFKNYKNLDLYSEVILRLAQANAV